MPDSKGLSKGLLKAASLGIALVVPIDRSLEAQDESRSHQRAMPMAAVTSDWGGASLVEVPFERHRNWLVIPISINGSPPLRFVLDTGASLMLIPDEEVAERFGIEVQSRGMVQGAGDGEPVQAGFAAGLNVEIGSLNLSGLQAAIGIGQLPLRGLDGVIGAAVFNAAVVEFDFSAGVLRLHEPDGFSYQGTGSSMPLEVSPTYRVPYLVDVPISVDGQWFETNVILDTGRGGMELWRAPPPSPYKTIEALGGWGAQGSDITVFGRGVGIRLGDHEFRDMVSSFEPEGQLASIGANMENSATIGTRILRRFRMFVDYRGKRLILEPGEGIDEPFVFDNTNGIGLERSQPGAPFLSVFFVIPGSPADHAGIQAKDRIIEINGASVRSLTTEEIRNMWELPPGTQLQLKLERGEQALELGIITARIP